MTRLALLREGRNAVDRRGGAGSVHERFRFRQARRGLAAVLGRRAAPRSAGGGRVRRQPDDLSRSRAAAARSRRPVGALPGRPARRRRRLAAQLDRWLAAGTAETLVRGRPPCRDGPPGPGSTCATSPSWCSGPAPRWAHWCRCSSGGRTSSPSTCRSPRSGPACSTWPGRPAGSRSPWPAAAGGRQDDRSPAGRVSTSSRIARGWRRGWPRSRPFTLGNYLYADGAAHVRAAVAVDVLDRCAPGRARRRLARVPRHADRRLRRARRGGRGQPAPLRGAHAARRLRPAPGSARRRPTTRTAALSGRGRRSRAGERLARAATGPQLRTREAGAALAGAGWRGPPAGSSASTSRHRPAPARCCCNRVSQRPTPGRTASASRSSTRRRRTP